MSWCDEHECPGIVCGDYHEAPRPSARGRVPSQVMPPITTSDHPSPVGWLRLVFAAALGFWLARSCLTPEPVPANACQCNHANVKEPSR